MTRKSFLFLTLAFSIPVMAGPPLICEKFDDGKSLPWIESKDWNGADPSYEVSRLVDDTLALLTPSAPIKARMETMRRAAIYSAKVDGLAERLVSQLVARDEENLALALHPPAYCLQGAAGSGLG